MTLPLFEVYPHCRCCSWSNPHHVEVHTTPCLTCQTTASGKR